MFLTVVDSSSLVDEIASADQSGDDDRLEGLMCGAVKHLHGNRSKPDQIVYLSLMHLAKSRPTIFNSDIVIEVTFLLLCQTITSFYL